MFFENGSTGCGAESLKHETRGFYDKYFQTIYMV
jgi:hypothetical protein